MPTDQRSACVGLRQQRSRQPCRRPWLSPQQTPPQVGEGSDQPATVTVIQRNSPTSGWKVGAINAGRSPIGGIEPDLDRVVADTVEAGLLSASHEYAAARDADVVLICTQTDKRGWPRPPRSRC